MSPIEFLRLLGARETSVAVAALGLLVLSACQSGERMEGKVLDLGNPASSALPVATGELWLWNDVYIGNPTDRTIEIQRVRANAPEPSGIEILGYEIGLRGQPPIPAGYYKTYPPMDYYPQRKVCGRENLVPLKGFELEPGVYARVDVVFRVREEPGQISIPTWRVFYKDGEEELYQDSPFALILKASADRPPEDLLPEERACLHKTQSLEDAIADGTYKGEL